MDITVMFCQKNVFTLCKQGEYGNELSFNYQPWIDQFGDGSIGWLIQRPNDPSAYPLTSTEEDGISTIKLTETETQFSGKGLLEVYYINDGETEKRISNTATFYIEPTLQNTGDVPSPWQSYIDQIHIDQLKTIMFCLPHDVAEGTVASFYDGADDIPVRELVTSIIGEQSGEGNPSPENIRAIETYDSVEIVVSPTQDAEDGVTYTVPLGESVYMGELNVTTGVLTVTHVCRSISEYEWETATSTRYGSYFRTKYDVEDYAVNNDYVSDIYMYGNPLGWNTSTNFQFTLLTNKFQVVDRRYETAEDFMAHATGHIAYKLRTPYQVQLTPTIVKTYLGNNRIWSNSGDITVDYCADTTLFINAGTSIST